VNELSHTPATAEVSEPDWLVDPTLAPEVAGDVLAPLYAGAAVGVLALPFCPACGLALELEQRVCDGCAGGPPVWRPVEPTATVHSVTVVHRLEAGLVRTRSPYPLADVELASGHRLIAAPLHPATEPPAIGERVSMGFRVIGGVAVPAFIRHTSVPSTMEESR
jgi:uncharacterized OB-fold protein